MIQNGHGKEALLGTGVDPETIERLWKKYKQ